jgi:hypothetical protein
MDGFQYKEEDFPPLTKKKQKKTLEDVLLVAAMYYASLDPKDDVDREIRTDLREMFRTVKNDF